MVSDYPEACHTMFLIMFTTFHTRTNYCIQKFCFSNMHCFRIHQELCSTPVHNTDDSFTGAGVELVRCFMGHVKEEDIPQYPKTS